MVTMNIWVTRLELQEMGDRRKIWGKEAGTSSTLLVSVSLGWNLGRMTEETEEGEDDEDSNSEKEAEEEECDSWAYSGSGNLITLFPQLEFV